MTVYATYALPVLLGLAVLLFFPVTKHLTSRGDKLQYYVLQGITFVGAIVGAKLAAVVGDTGWPVRELPGGLLTALSSGRSITGGLLGGLLFAEIAKPLLGYHRPPNDRFAAVLPFSIAIGRVGCHLTGCCAGLPHEGLLSVHDAHGVARWPAQLFEVFFQLAVGIAFMSIVRRGGLGGRLFSLYLVLYGLFRFASEFLRDTPKLLGPISVYQALALVMAAVGAGLFAYRTNRGAVGASAGAATALGAS